MKFPSAVVTVMFAVPSARAVTIPDELTVATLLLEVLQLTFLLEAFAGSTMAERVVVSPAFMLAEEGLTVTPVTGIEATVIWVVEVSPFVVVAVMIAVPDATAVTSPEALTVATGLFPELQVTVG